MIRDEPLEYFDDLKSIKTIAEHNLNAGLLLLKYYNSKYKTNIDLNDLKQEVKEQQEEEVFMVEYTEKRTGKIA